MNTDTLKAENAKLKAEVRKLRKERDDAVRCANQADIHKVHEMAKRMGWLSSLSEVEGLLGSGLADEYLRKADLADREDVISRLRMLADELATCAGRHGYVQDKAGSIDVKAD